MLQRLLEEKRTAHQEQHVANQELINVLLELRVLQQSLGAAAPAPESAAAPVTLRLSELLQRDDDSSGATTKMTAQRLELLNEL